MVHGLGEAHNADVLLVPPVTLPLSPSTLLVVECKGYRNNVSLDVIRGAVGLRLDLNAFRQLSAESIEHRVKGGRRLVPEHFPYFHVGVASLYGFSGPAQHYAAAHHVELLDYSKLPLLGTLSDLIEALPEVRPGPNWRLAVNSLLGGPVPAHVESLEAELALKDLGDPLRAALEPIRSVLSEVRASYVATLASGLTVNMLGRRPLQLQNPLGSSDFTFRAHFTDRTSNTWRLETGNDVLEFAVPSQLLSAWEERGRPLRHAADLKLQHLKRIELVGPVSRPDGSQAFRHIVGELDPSYLEAIAESRR